MENLFNILDKTFWNDAVRVAIYLTNRTETSAVLDHNSPAEI